MNKPPTADMSVVLLAPVDFDTLRKTVRCLRAQTVADRLEIVIVTPSAENLGFDVGELEGFWGYRVVEAADFASGAVVRALGVREATAPLVVFGEDHCFPDPGWAEALIGAHHKGPWVAVGPMFANANPATLISWADFLLGYGPWIEPMPAGEVPFLPGHNSSYKRQILLDYGPQLPAMLKSEMVMHGDLWARGYRLYLEPAARTSHVNFTIVSSWVAVIFHTGRLVAGARGEHWPGWRRLVYFCGAPLIPLVRMWRLVRELRRPGRPRHLIPRVLPLLGVGLALDGAGQMLGYLLGTGNALVKVARYELYRHRRIQPQEQQVFTITGTL